MRDFERLVTSLRRWTKNHDPHVRAAAELLIWDRYWLERLDFRAAAMGQNEAGQAWIAWDDAARFRAGPGATASSSQLAILDIAVAIGGDAFRLSRMDDGQARAIVAAVAGALAVEVIIGD